MKKLLLGAILLFSVLGFGQSYEFFHSLNTVIQRKSSLADSFREARTSNLKGFGVLKIDMPLYSIKPLMEVYNGKLLSDRYEMQVVSFNNIMVTKDILLQNVVLKFYKNRLFSIRCKDISEIVISKYVEFTRDNCTEYYTTINNKRTVMLLYLNYTGTELCNTTVFEEYMSHKRNLESIEREKQDSINAIKYKNF